MPNYASLIDPAEFGLIADYLRSPRTPIDHLLHVNSKETLAVLAEEFVGDRYVNYPPWLFPDPVERGLREGSLLVSSRFSLSLCDPKQILDARTVPRHALCHVIYAPPFYLVHTPGLFEGTLIRANVAHNPGEDLQQKRARRINM
jgi:hypothetical protein